MLCMTAVYSFAFAWLLRVFFAAIRRWLPGRGGAQDLTCGGKALPARGAGFPSFRFAYDVLPAAEAGRAWRAAIVGQ